MIRVRFAPSPTGFLHIGNARTALFNWLFAKKNNGAFILRIEDTDVERSSDRYMHSIMEDLRWLGLEWDEGPDIGGSYGPYRQSLRNSIYEKYFSILKNKGLVYPCYCAKEELEERRFLSAKKREPPRYDNRCRDLSPTSKDKYEKEGRRAVWRFKVPAKTVVVRDVVRGNISFDTSLIGDFVIIKQDGNPTFNFAVSVDDICMKITHIIRGEDHLPNTPRHILLWEAFSEEPPVVAHNTLTLGSDGERLSKRHGAVSVREYRRLGYMSSGLINYLALLGWSPGAKKELFSTKELMEVFTLERFSSSPALFNKEKLDWINSCHIRNMDSDKLTNLCIPYLKRAKLLKRAVSMEQFSSLEKMISAIKGNLVILSDCVGLMKIFLGDIPPIERVEDYCHDLFKTLYNRFLETDGLTPEKIKEIFSSAQKILGITGKNFYMPIRLALTGMSEGPELLDIIPLIGKEKILKRLCRS